MPLTSRSRYRGSWQDPSYAFGDLLGAMRRVAHPRYAELRESWKTHRRRVFRDAVEHEL